MAGELASVAGGRVVEETFDGGQDAPLDRRVKLAGFQPARVAAVDLAFDELAEGLGDGARLGQRGGSRPSGNWSRGPCAHRDPARMQIVRLGEPFKLAGDFDTICVHCLRLGLGRCARPSFCTCRGGHNPGLGLMSRPSDPPPPSATAAPARRAPRSAENWTLASRETCRASYGVCLPTSLFRPAAIVLAPPGQRTRPGSRRRPGCPSSGFRSAGAATREAAPEGSNSVASPSTPSKRSNSFWSFAANRPHSRTAARRDLPWRSSLTRWPTAATPPPPPATAAPAPRTPPSAGSAAPPASARARGPTNRPPEPRRTAG